jgi:hypothetical protein
VRNVVLGRRWDGNVVMSVSLHGWAKIEGFCVLGVRGCRSEWVLCAWVGVAFCDLVSSRVGFAVAGNSLHDVLCGSLVSSVKVKQT